MYVPAQIFFTAKQNDQDQNPDLEQYLHTYDVTSRLVCTLPPSECSKSLRKLSIDNHGLSIDIQVYFAQHVRMDTGVSMASSMQFVSHVRQKWWL